MILSPAFTSSYTPIWYLTLILWLLSELYLIYRDRNTTKSRTGDPGDISGLLSSPEWHSHAS
ncbi:hypothetical protein [Methanospirillum lacunae]|uniref:Uncharacterized protein n=1 Tax=Methanospirillum lacunae TaxID=668570 RepID=A0A2V2MWL6_9EURY|nr:hypothetical protein [Methanospirillum lacunae]PWR72554.1 hypothetical protein DK846_06185 [Methanospirillum lacunae]